MASSRRHQLVVGLITMTFVPCAFAFSWTELWATPNQLGAKALKAKQPLLAATQFEDTAWRGVAHFKSQKYQQAAKDFAHTDTSLAHYNRGNALAMAHEFKQAITAYDKALAKNPADNDAKFNKALIEKLLKQQQKQQSKQNQSGDQQQQANMKKQSGKNKQQQSTNKKQQNQNNKQQQASGKGQKNKQSPENKKQANNKQGQSPQPKHQTDKKPQSKSAMAKLQKKRENRQMTDQWLRRIDDTPGGLLRQKFLRDYRLRLQNS